MPTNDAAKIARLNDQLRTTFRGGTTWLTAGVDALPEPVRSEILEQVRRFDGFSPDNDPYGEHDCAVIEVDGLSVIFKIDYYDTTLTRHSDDPADAALTRRVLTIMLAAEY